MSEYSNKLISQLNRKRINEIADIIADNQLDYVKIVKLILNAAQIYMPINQATLREPSLTRLRIKIVQFLILNDLNAEQEDSDEINSNYDTNDENDDIDSDETDSDDENASSRTFTTSIEHKLFRQKYELFFEELIVYYGTSVLEDENNILLTFLHRMSSISDVLLYTAITLAGLKIMTGLVKIHNEPTDDLNDGDESHDDFVNVQKHFGVLFEKFFKTRCNIENVKLLIVLSNEMINWLDLKPILVLNKGCFDAIFGWIEIAHVNEDGRGPVAVAWKKLNENCSTIVERIRTLAINMYETDRALFDEVMVPLCEQFLHAKFIFDDEMVILRVDTLNFGLMIAERLPGLIEYDDLADRLKAVICSLNGEDRELARASAKFLCATLWKCETDEQVGEHLLELLDLIANEPPWQDFNHSAFLVDALMFVHPMVTDWKLLLDICFDSESSLLRTIVAFDVLQRSVFYLLDASLSSPAKTLEVTDAVRLEKKKLFNQIFLNDYLKLLRKYTFNNDFYLSILKMASFFDSKLIDENDHNKTLIMQIVHELIRTFNETDKYCSEIIEMYQETIVDEETTAQKILRYAINVLITFKDEFPFCQEIIADFVKDLHGNYMIEFRRWTRDNQLSMDAMKNYTKTLIRVMYVQILTDFEDLTWKVIYDEFFNCKKPLAFHYAYIASIKMCHDFIVKTMLQYRKKRASLTNDLVAVFAQNRNNFLLTVTEYFEKSTVNLQIRRECFMELQYLYALFDRRCLRQFTAQQSIVEKLAVPTDIRICDTIVQFLKEYVCNRTFPDEVNPKKPFGQMRCLNTLHFMILRKKYPIEPFVEIFRELLQANQFLKVKAEQVLKQNNIS